MQSHTSGKRDLTWPWSLALRIDSEDSAVDRVDLTRAMAVKASNE